MVGVGLSFLRVKPDCLERPILMSFGVLVGLKLPEWALLDQILTTTTVQNMKNLQIH